MELIFYGGSSLLEGPVWDSENKLIYCVSIDQGIIYQINTTTTEVKSFLADGSVGCVALTKDNCIITAEKNGIFKINVETGEKVYLIQLESNKELRYNDGKFDPIGRFIVGTKSEKDYFVDSSIIKGKLFSYYNKTYKILLDDLLISNGIGFSAEGDIMYFIDTPTKKVGQYKYNLENGDIKFDKYIIDIEGPGWPDGMCVDLDGNIWVAEWEGARVRKWDINTGKVLNEIKVPCDRVTSCCLGGTNLNELYITTAKKEGDFLGGSLFRHKLF